MMTPEHSLPTQLICCHMFYAFIFIQIMCYEKPKLSDPLFSEKMPPRREKKQGSTMGEVHVKDLYLGFS